MKSTTRSESVLRWWEFAVAVVATAGVLILHIRFLTHAGPLWRDEISSLNIAGLTSAKEFFAALVFDSMPALFPVVLRAWHSLGFAHTDFSLRMLGFLIGVILVGTLCCRAISKRNSAPLWPLVLFGMNPLVIGEGDSMRPYGLGMLLLVISFALIWRITFQDRHLHLVFAAAITAALSVQALYINSLMIFAICLAGIVLCALNKDWRRVAVIFLIGLFAAASLVPYLSILRASRDLFAIQAIGAGLASATSEFISTLGSGSRLTVAICGVLFALGVSATTIPRLSERVGADDFQRHLVFALVTVLVASVTTIAFVWKVDLPLNRYFLPLLAIIALCIHVFAEPLRNRLTLRAGNLIGAAIAAVAIFFPSYASLGVRSTNCDRAAAFVTKQTTADDFIIVTRFSFGISFARYYHGAASWRTIPDISDHTQHRLDLVKNAMAQPDPLRHLFSQIEATLKAGHRIYVVGSLPSAEPTEPLPPAPQSAYGWKMFAYTDNWQQQLARFIDQHGREGEEISLGDTEPIEPRENLGVFVVNGWQDRQ